MDCQIGLRLSKLAWVEYKVSILFFEDLFLLLADVFSCYKIRLRLSLT